MPGSSEVPPTQWFSTGGRFCCPHTCDNIWRNFWLPQLGGMPPVAGRGPGRCETSENVQHGPHNNHLAQDAHSGEGETLVYSMGEKMILRKPPEEGWGSWAHTAQETKTLLLRLFTVSPGNTLTVSKQGESGYCVLKTLKATSSTSSSEAAHPSTARTLLPTPGAPGMFAITMAPPYLCSN